MAVWATARRATAGPTRATAAFLREHAADAVALIAIVLVAWAAFGGLVLAPVEATFGEATPFYGTPNQIARSAFLEFGSAPIWDFRTGAGEPLLANPLATQFYPLTFIAYLAANPPLDGVRWTAFVHLVGAAIAMYAFARVAGARPLPALIAPVLFVLNAHTSWRIANGFLGQISALLWVPAVAALVVVALRRRSWAIMALAGAAMSMLILAGTVYDLYFAGLAVAALVIAHAIASARGRSIPSALRAVAQVAGLSAVALAVMVGLSAIKLIPVAAFQPLSTRVGFSLEEAEVGLENIPTATELARLVLDQVPTGVVPLINVLAVAAAAAAILRPTRVVLALLAMAVIGLWASLGMRAPLDLYAFFHGVLPGFAFNNTTLRFMNLFYFAFAALAAIGLSNLLELIRRRAPALRPRATQLAAVALVGLTAAGSVLPMRGVVAQAVGVDALPAEPAEGSSHAYFADIQARDGPHSFRVFSTYLFSRGAGRVTPTTAALYGLDTVDPINTHMVPSYQVMFDFAPDAGTFRRQNVLLSVLNAAYFVYEDQYSLGAPSGAGAPVKVDGGVIYRNPEALARAQVIPRAILIIGDDADRDFNAFEARLLVFRPEFDPHHIAVLHGGSPYVDDYELDELLAFDAIALTRWKSREATAASALLAAYARAGGRVFDLDYASRPEPNPFLRSGAFLRDENPSKRLRPSAATEAGAVLAALHERAATPARVDVAIEKYTPNEMTFRTGANRRPMAFLFSQTFFPGWTASVDGRPVRLYMADSLINGVILPPGDEHVVTFRFSPITFLVGAAITLATLGVLVGAMVWRWWPRRTRNRAAAS